MNKEIVLVMDTNNRIPQKNHESESLDVKMIQNGLIKKGYSVVVTNYFELINSYEYEDIKGRFFYYASSQYTFYKEYINDCLLYIIRNKGVLLPDYHLFVAHENKAYQALEKKRLGIVSPKTYVIGSFEEGEKLLKKLDYPFIAKVAKGFASRGVDKITSYKEGRRFLRKYMFRLDGRSFMEKGIHLFRKIKHRKSYAEKTGKIIFQEMIEGLDYDWKVIVFYDRIYTLKRYTRQGDFRASGSGLFDFEEEAPKEVLDYAFNVNQQLNSPFTSLDIAVKDNIAYLIEYQALHYGLVTVKDNDYYHELNEDGHWIKETKNIVAEENIVYALDNYILRLYK